MVAPFCLFTRSDTSFKLSGKATPRQSVCGRSGQNLVKQYGSCIQTSNELVEVYFCITGFTTGIFRQHSFASIRSHPVFVIDHSSDSIYQHQTTVVLIGFFHYFQWLFSRPVCLAGHFTAIQLCHQFMYSNRSRPAPSTPPAMAQTLLLSAGD